MTWDVISHGSLITWKLCIFFLQKTPRRCYFIPDDVTWQRCPIGKSNTIGHFTQFWGRLEERKREEGGMEESPGFQTSTTSRVQRQWTVCQHFVSFVSLAGVLLILLTWLLTNCGATNHLRLFLPFLKSRASNTMSAGQCLEEWSPGRFLTGLNWSPSKFILQSGDQQTSKGKDTNT